MQQKALLAAKTNDKNSTQTKLGLQRVILKLDVIWNDYSMVAILFQKINCLLENKLTSLQTERRKMRRNNKEM